MEEETRLDRPEEEQPEALEETRLDRPVIQPPKDAGPADDTRLDRPVLRPPPQAGPDDETRLDRPVLRPPPQAGPDDETRLERPLLKPPPASTALAEEDDEARVALAAPSRDTAPSNRPFAIALIVIIVVGIVGWLVLRRYESTRVQPTRNPEFEFPAQDWEIIVAPTPAGGVPATRGRARWAYERPFDFPAGAEAPRTPFGEVALEAGRRHGIDPRFLAAVMSVESAFNPKARSHKGALGLMQIMPTTGRMYGASRSDLLEPNQNIHVGARHLKMLARLYDEDPALVLAAYNAGEGAVDRYQGIPPFEETRNYVKKVRRTLFQLPRLSGISLETAAGP